MSTVNRRHAREWALQLLFQLDANPVDDLKPVIRSFWQQQLRLKQDIEDDARTGSFRDSDVIVALGEPTPEAAAELLAPKRLRAFTEKLVDGVTTNLDAIDERLARYTQNWPLHRMGGVDRNVLRLAIYEMFFDEHTPPVVVINEAVDLAKFFSSSESGRFVNGILDRACREVARPPRDRSGGPSADRRRASRAGKAPQTPDSAQPS